MLLSLKGQNRGIVHNACFRLFYISCNTWFSGYPWGIPSILPSVASLFPFSFFPSFQLDGPKIIILT